jgi:hypothetical protein
MRARHASEKWLLDCLVLVTRMADVKIELNEIKPKIGVALCYLFFFRI